VQNTDPEYYRSAPLVAIEPEDGCENISNGAELVGAVVIVKHGKCLWIDKALNIAQYGGVGMIVGNEANWLVEMSRPRGDSRNVDFPCVFIAWQAYDSVLTTLSSAPSGSVFATISPQGEYSIEHPSWSTLSFPRIAIWLLIMMVMFGAGLTIARLCCEIFWSGRFFERQISEIPEVLFSNDLLKTQDMSRDLAGEYKSNGKYLTNTDCPVCLESFVEKETIKLLPCGHGFHPECIEPWIAGRKDSCPICRQSVMDKLDTEYRVCCCSITRRQSRPLPNADMRFDNAYQAENPSPPAAVQMSSM